ncbi:MAG: hypothetical protein KGJ07_07990 [Patescibacteria group bacterium]|nr:hypothetical protein [Patescibacteria group bacterium]
MKNNKYKLRELFAEARAIYFALLNNAVSKEKGIQKIEIILAEINKETSHIAKKHGIKHKDLTYKDLGGIL